MDMGVNRGGETCPLYKSTACALLNMPACKDCPIFAGEDVRSIAEMTDGFLKNTEGVDIPALFESGKCAFCRGEAQAADGYAVYDMGHAVKAEQPRGFKRLLRRVPSYDMLLPLQLCCCKRCRKNIRLVGNVKTLCFAGCLAVALVPVCIERSAEAMRAVFQGMPFAVLVLAALLGRLLGRLLQKKLTASYEKETVLKAAELPAVKKLNALGWKRIMEQEGVTFTSKRLDKGLGTAPGAVYERICKENSSESVDNTGLN